MTAKNLQDDVDKEDLSATTGNSCYKHFIIYVQSRKSNVSVL